MAATLDYEPCGSSTSTGSQRRASVEEAGCWKNDGGALEVEFLTLDGHTAALATVSSSQVRPATGAEITHARDF